MSFLFRYLRFHDIIGGIHVPVDDGVDKLNRKYTLLVFLFLALPIFTKQYIGDPIECFAPVYFAEHQARYINSYCWTQSTYYVVPIGDLDDDGDQQEPPDRIMPDEMDYFIGFESVTHIGNERLRRVRVSYYQWAPLILLVQGLCFYIPFLIWNSCANNAGVKLRRLLKKASDIASLPPGCQQREALLAEFVDQFHTLVTGEAGWCADLQCGLAGGSGHSQGGSSASSSSSSASSGPPGRAGGQAGGGRGQSEAESENRRGHRGQQAGCCLVGLPVIGSLLGCCLRPCASFGLMGPSKYLCLLYLAVKTAYVFNVGLQFFLLGQFLGKGYLKHGLELVNRLIMNGDWWASPRFPLSTLCQVRADMSGGLRSYTCQCVLPINVFNEKIFSVVWFYMAFLMPLNVLSLLFWIYRTFESNRLSYIRLCLWRTRLVELNQIHRTVRRLSQSYLGWDGVFLLRLIEHNHGSIMATLIMSRLWEFYANQMKLQEDQNQLTLQSNAQHTLQNTTTAISSQHQLLAAHAAAQAAAAGHAHHHGAGPPQLMQPGAAGHAHANHAHPAQQHPPHSHQPLMPVQVPLQGQQQQAHFGAPNAGPHHAHHQGPGFAGGGGGGGGHGPLAHHAGQISGQPSGHHPLHAANTHHGHHPRPLPAGSHLAGPFASGASASLLAQLQHQHQHHAPAGQPPNASQQSASGNVAAAVAALAAAAAAATNSTNTNQLTPGSSSSVPATAAAAASTAAGSSAASAAPQQQQAQPAQAPPPSAGGPATTASSAAQVAAKLGLASLGGPPAASPVALKQQQKAAVGSGPQPGGGAAAGRPAHHHALHPTIQSLLGQQQSSTGGGQQQQAAGSSPPSSSSSAGAAAGTPPGPAQQVQPAALTSQSAGQNASTAGAGLASGHQHTTTSFINASPGGAPPNGPPLPPPPPAHVVAAAAAATGSAPGMARTGTLGPGARGNAAAQSAANLQQAAQFRRYRD